MKPAIRRNNSALIIRIILYIWAIHFVMWLVLRITGFQVLDGLWGVYNNQIWQDNLQFINLVYLIITIPLVLAAAITMGVKRYITKARSVLLSLLSILMPVLLVFAALLFPFHFEKSSDPNCARGRENLEKTYNTDCSYDFKIDFNW